MNVTHIQLEACDTSSGTALLIGLKEMEKREKDTQQNQNAQGLSRQLQEVRMK